MTFEQLFEILKKNNMPVTYRDFPELNEPEPPYICFYSDESNNFYADGVVYFSSSIIYIELYLYDKDPKIEKDFEKNIKDIPWTKEEEYDNEEKIYKIKYKVEV